MLLRLSFFCGLAVVAAAQSSPVSGGLQGIVTDSTGGRIADAKVTIREIDTRQVRNAPTNEEGIYRFLELPPGTYQLSISYPGFVRYQHAGIAVPLGAMVHQDVALGLAGTEAITVSAQPPALDPAQTSVATSVDTERIEELPVESRNYLNFVLLAPGAAASAQGAGGRSLAPLPDSGFSFGGLRGRSNNVAIDGLDNNDEYAGSSRTELSLETVQEFQVVNSGISAETGGASGGSINVITRAGANQIHGDAFVFLQNGALDAREPFETERAAPAVHRYRTGVAMGGPVVKDRTFYYAAFEQEHQRSREDSYLSPTVTSAVNGILASGLYPRLAGLRLNDDYFPAARAETEASAKVNHQWTRRNSVMLRYAYTNNREAGDAFHSAGWYDPSARGSAFTDDHAVVGALTTVFDSNTVGDFRFQFASRQAVLRTNDGEGPGAEIAGLVFFGRPYDGNGRREERHRQAAYTLSRAAGRHLLKAGATYNRVGLDAAMADGFGGTYIFATLADFALGTPNAYRQAFGGVRTGFAVQNYGAFAQDHWSAARGLTLDVGVRYDYEHLPAALPQDRDNFSPRVGAAYQLPKTWVARAGFGLFYDRYVLASVNPLLQKNGVNGFEQVNFGAPSIYRAGGLPASYSSQSSFAVEHQLARDLTVTASLLDVAGIHLARTRNVNLLPPGPVFGAGRIDPRFDNIYQLEGSAHSSYRGASLMLNRRMSDELEFSLGYTLSKTNDDASDFDEQPMNPYNLAAERAFSRQDQRHRLVFNALWELPVGDEEDRAAGARKQNWAERAFSHLELAPIFSVESGLPVNPITGFDSNGNGAWPLSSRPLGIARNSARAPMLANTDLRVLKYFPVSKAAHLDLVAEAFNLFNRANVAQVNPVAGPMFLQPLAGPGARKIQFSLDYEF